MATDVSTDSNGKLIGILIAAASILSIVMMAHHPSVGSHEAAEVAAELARKATIDRVVHGTLIALSGLLLFGLVEFSARIGSARSVARAAVIAFAIGIGAEICAATISGFIVADLGTHYAGTPDTDLLALRHLLFLCMRANQAFAAIGVIAMAVAIVLWSVALLRTRANAAIGIVGLILGAGPALALLFGALRLDVHGMLLVVVANALWYLAISVQLMRGKL